jgi:hypothetical protein
VYVCSIALGEIAVERTKQLFFCLKGPGAPVTRREPI